MGQSLFSIRATYIALAFYSVFGVSVGLSNLIFSTGHIIDFVIPTSCGILIAWLLVYLHKSPEARHTATVKYLFFLTIYSFVTPSWYFTVGAEIYDWKLVEEFPPISGVILIAISVLIAMVPKSWLRYTMIMWGAICLPILVYLITHPSEISTARGREMMIFFGPGGILFFIVLSYQRDVLLRFQLAEQHLKSSRRQADHDELTNICNRRGLINWLSEQAKSDPKISGLVIDIDHFKHINDTHGHQTGDTVLKEVARLLEACLSSQSCLARWGGDEFVIFLNNQSDEQVKRIAHTCWQSISGHHFPLIGQVTCSIGGAPNIESNDIDVIIRSADACLYQAKRQGRNQVVVQSRQVLQKESSLQPKKSL